MSLAEQQKQLCDDALSEILQHIGGFQGCSCSYFTTKLFSHNKVCVKEHLENLQHVIYA